MRVRFLPWGLLTLVCLAINLLFVAYPLAVLSVNSFRGVAGGLSLAGFARFLANPDYLAALRNTVILASIVTGTATLIAVPLAFIVARYRFPFKPLIAVLPLTTIIIPEIIVSQSWILMLGNNGVVTTALAASGIQIGSFYGWPGLITVLTLVFYTYVYLGVLAALRGFDGQLEEASRSLGYSPGQTILRVVLPTMAPAILVNALVVFTLVVGNFAVSTMLGARIPLLSVETYNAFVTEMGGSPLMQSTLSLVTITLIAVVLFVQKRLVERKMVQMVQGRAPEPQPLRGAAGVAVVAFLVSVLALSLLPLATVFVAAFTASRGPVMRWGEWSTQNLERAWTFGFEPIANSLRFASAATIVGVIFAVLVSYLLVKKRTAVSQALDYIVVLPMAISGTILGIALVQTFNTGLFVLTGTTTIMMIAYVVRRLPFSIRSASSTIFNIPDSIEEASISLGVSPLRSFVKVVLPVMKASVIAAAVLMWATTLSELSASIVVYSGGLETIPIAIFRQVDGGRMGQAAAYGAILVSLIVLPVLLVTRLFNLNLFAGK